MQSKIGEIYDGKVSGLTSFGAFVRLSNGETGMVHISEVSAGYVKEIGEHLTEGQDVRVKVIGINDNRKISLSIKQADQNYVPRSAANPREGRERNSGSAARRDRPQPDANRSSSGAMSFEDMMAKFKKDSEEKISVLKKSTDFKGGKRGGRP